MKFELYKCEHCGNIIMKLVDSGVTPVCCGEPMEALKANTVDASKEKHVPKVMREDSKIAVLVGEEIHPMTDDHYIAIIAAVSGDTVTIRLPQSGDKPILGAYAVEKVTAYEYCTKHGFWAAEEEIKLPEPPQEA